MKKSKIHQNLRAILDEQPERVSLDQFPESFAIRGKFALFIMGLLAALCILLTYCWRG